jgi:hypothetical protein
MASTLNQGKRRVDGVSGVQGGRNGERQFSTKMGSGGLAGVWHGLTLV